MEIDVGSIIGGKYELVRLLGKGAMGEVWLANHATIGGEFAVKLVRLNQLIAEGMDLEEATGRFLQEAQIASKLSRRTRHIVSVTDHGEEDGFAYLVMEKLEGETFEAFLTRRPMDVAELVPIVNQIARALGLAHNEGIFHRDLKPGNVFLTHDEDGRLTVKLLDFGIARAMRPVRQRSKFSTGRDIILGTPSYMSPEQIRGLASLDHRCDLWALATCAYEALTGKLPVDGETVEDQFIAICTYRIVPASARRPDLPPAVDRFFAKAFAEPIEGRFLHAGDLAQAFAAIMDPSLAERAVRPPEPSLPDVAPIVSSGVRSGTTQALGSVRPSAPEPDPIPVMMGQGTSRTQRKRRGGVLAPIAGAAIVLAMVGAFFGFRKSHDETLAPTTKAAGTKEPPSATDPSTPPPPATFTAESPTPAEPRTAPTASNGPAFVHALAKGGPRAPTASPSVHVPATPTTPTPPADPRKTAAPTPPPPPKPTAAATTTPTPTPTAAPSTTTDKLKVF